MGENIKRQLIIGLVGGLNFIFAFIWLNKWIEEKYIFEEYKTSAISLLITCLLNVSLAFLLGINYLIIFICFSLIEFVFAIVFTVKAYKDDEMNWYYFLLTQVFVIFFLIFVVLGVTIS